MYRQSGCQLKHSKRDSQMAVNTWVFLLSFSLTLGDGCERVVELYDNIRNLSIHQSLTTKNKHCTSPTGFFPP